MENTKHFRYIDEDKFIPWIDREIKELYESLDPCNYAKVRELEKIKNGVIIGLWSWQEGS